VQLPFPPPLPPGFVPPPSGFLEFVMLYIAVLELILIALPGRIRNRVLEILLPFLRRPL
jgi:hypothetical protein